MVPGTYIKKYNVYKKRGSMGGNVIEVQALVSVSVVDYSIGIGGICQYLIGRCNFF